MEETKISSSSSNTKHHHNGHHHHHHHRHPCLPPHKRTYLTIGQDLYSIDEYLKEQYNSTLHWYMRSVARHHHHHHHRVDAGSTTTTTTTSTISIQAEELDDDDDDDDNYSSEDRIPVPRPEDEVPAALMVYTDIQKLKGLDMPIDYGSGIEWADGALRLASPPNNNLGVGLQIGLWLGGVKGCRDIISGKLDYKVNELVHYLGQTPSSSSGGISASKIFLRIGYEFDNVEFGYWTDPEAYKEAFRYIVNKCTMKKSCRRRVAMVWHSWAAGLPAINVNSTTLRTLEDYYPGDDVVDWIGVSVFQQFYPNNIGGSVQDLENVLNFAAIKSKPTMIAESTPFGGIHNNAILGEKADIWKVWFEPVLALIEKFDIGMWSYINCNWDVQPLWIGTGFGDTRLSIDAEIMDKWYDNVVGSRKFIRATDFELCAYEHQYDDDDDDDDDENFHFNQYNNHHQDDDYVVRTHPKSRKVVSRSRWFWGHERLGGAEGIWEAVLPIVMLSSSLAIIIFLLFTTRRPSRRLDRTPRAQRIRFAILDAMERDDDDCSTALYGSTDDCDSLHWRDSVRRVSSNLVVANTKDGTTIVA